MKTTTHQAKSSFLHRLMYAGVLVAILLSLLAPYSASVALADSGTPTIDNPWDLGTAEFGVPYSLELNVSGGTPPYTFWTTPQDWLNPDNLPPGLEYAANPYRIIGTPTASGVFDFWIHVQDSTPGGPITAEYRFRMFVQDETTTTLSAQPVYGPVVPFIASVTENSDGALTPDAYWTVENTEVVPGYWIWISIEVDPGYVTFKDSGNIILGCESVAVHGGKATCSPELTNGEHQITAEFLGNRVVLPSASAPVAYTPECDESLTVTNAETDGAGSLRAAVAAPGRCVGSRIIFAGDLSINLIPEEITVHRSVTIDGEDHKVSLTGIGAVLDVPESAGDIAVTLQNLTVANAWCAVKNSETMTISNVAFSGNRCTYGGSVNNDGGTMTVSNSTFNGNRAETIQVDGIGGAILNSGSLSVSASTFIDNSATRGGAIANTSSLAVTNSTFSGNFATDKGGGIWSDSGAQLTVANSTFSGNSIGTEEGSFGPGIGYDSTDVTISNSIMANNLPTGKCTGTQHSNTGSHNLTDDATCDDAGFTQTDSILLGTLGFYGGSTQTIPLLEGSAAIDAGNSAACPTNDQRGVARPQDGDGDGTAICDVGAFEYQVGFRSPPVITLQPLNQNVPVGDPVTFSAAASSIPAPTMQWQMSTDSGTDWTDFEGATASPLEFTSSAELNGYRYRAVFTNSEGSATTDTAILTILNADPCTVIRPADSGAGTLRTILEDAGCATITFGADFTIYLASKLTISRDVTIDGAGHNIVIGPVSAPGGSTFNQMFYVNPGVSASLKTLTVKRALAQWWEVGAAIGNYGTLTVEGSTFAGNSTPFSAGAVYNDSAATLTVNRSTFAGNSAYQGGAIYNAGTLTLTDSTFTGNVGSAFGGAIYNSGTLTISGSTFDSNYLPDHQLLVCSGGAIYNASALVVTNSTFRGNVACTSGGAIYTDAGATLEVTNSAFVANSAPNGGAMRTFGTPTIAGSTFDGNMGEYGGAVNSGPLVVTNSTFRDNSAYEGGALLIRLDGTLNLTNSTFAENNATIGGAIDLYRAGSTTLMTAYNNILVEGRTGANCYIGSASVTAASNLVDDSGCGAGFTQAESILLGELGDYGGSTQTIPLLAGSAAIDTGDNAFCPATDQRGLARPQDGNGDGTATCDVGAYEVEYQPPVQSQPVITTQPLSQAVFVGDAVSFSAAASGNPVPIVQWQVSTDSGASWTNIDGATASPLTFTAAYTQNGYQYRAVFTNTEGSATSDAATLTVSKLAATVSLLDLSYTYDGQPKAATVTTSPAGLSVDVTYDGSATAPTNAGSYAVVATVNDANYQGTASGTLTIAKRAISVQADAKTKVYGESDPELTYQIIGGSLVGSATFSGALTRDPGEGAGTYPIILGTLALDSNYALTFFGADLTVQQGQTGASLIASPSSAHVGDPVTFTASVYPVAPAVGIPDATVSFYEDGFNTLLGSAQLVDGVAVFETSTLAIGTHSVSASYDGSTNWEGCWVGPVLVTIVDKEDATVTLSNLTQTYDGSPKSVTVTTDPAGLTVDVTYDGSETAPTHAGSYAVVATVDDTNYQGSASGTLTISPKTLVGSIVAEDKVYDGTMAATFTCLLEGVVSGDDVTCTGGTAAFASDYVGSWKVTATGVGLSGADAGNYTVNSTAEDDASITKRPITIQANDQTKTYGTAFTFLGTEFSIIEGTLVEGDTISSVTLTSAGAVADAPVAGSPHAIDPVSAVFSYGYASDYQITYAAGELTVERATLTVKANDQAVPYGAPLPALTVAYSGFVNGENQDVLTGEPDLSTTATYGSPAGTYPITVGAGSLSAENYAFTFTNGTLTIQKSHTATTLTASTNSAIPHQPVTFSAAVAPVAPAAGTPYGSVTFYDGATILAANTPLVDGQAQFTTSDLALGSHSITAVYSGDANRQGSESSAVSVQVTYPFTGFFSPVDNPPVINITNAGRSIPIKFGLGGDRGLDIFAAGYPQVQLVQCEAGPSDPIETYSSGSGLSYDSQAQRYTYVWKTQKSWAGKCGTFVMVLVDGTTHTAEFKFK